MHFTILGATGGIGKLLIPIVLEQGHEVTAYARAPKKVAPGGPNLRIVGGDLYNAEQMAEAIRGSDAVLSAFGPSTLRRTHLRRDFGRTLVRALRLSGVSRFIHVSSAFCFPGGGPVYFVMTNTLFRNVTSDHCDADNEMAQSDLDWTVLRPPRLTDGLPAGRIQVTAGRRAKGMTISRSDVASFILQEAVAPHYIRQFVGLSH